MTITLPSLIELFGLFGIAVFLAGAVYFVTGFIAVAFMDSSELGSIAAVALWPLTFVAFIAGLVIGWTWLL